MKHADRALAIASRIADGSAIDWPEADSGQVSPIDPAVLAELKAIASMATLHRAPSEWLSSEATSAGTRWGSLTILEPVAEGRFGQVYRAWDARLQRQVALKLLHAPSRAASASPTRAIEEARLLARVRHPNVLTVHGAESLDGQVGIWTEFIEGRTLEGRLTEHGPLPPEEAVAIGLDLCRAIAAVHDAGLLHRDVKTQNVMRETGGRIVLMDFGTGHDVELVPTNAGDLSGTPLYLAPELFTGGRPTVAGDVYALAVLLFHLLTGGYPVPGRTLEDVRAGHREGRAVRLRGVRPELPATLVETIERGLSADPSQRFESARAFEAALAGTQARVTKDPPPDLKTWRAWAAVGGFAATGLVAWLVLDGPGHRLQSDGPPAQITSPGPASTPAPQEAPPAVASDESRRSSPNGDPPASALSQGHRRLTPPPLLLNWPGQPSSDGRHWPHVVARDSGNDLWIWEPETGAKKPVTTNADRDRGAQESAMSADGRLVAFAWASQKGGSELLVAEADGSSPRRILPREAADKPVPIEWSRDGREVLCWLTQKNGHTDLALVPSSGGAPKILTTFETSPPRTARLSPNARFVVYDLPANPTSTQRDVFIVPAASGAEPHTLIGGAFDDFGPVWVPDGGRVFFLSNRAGLTEGWTIEVANGVAVGSPVRVADKLGAVSPIALANDGRYYYSLPASSTDIYTLKLDLAGALPPTDPVRVQPAAGGGRVGPSWSPDGKRLSYVTGRPGAKTVSILELSSGKVRDLELTPPLSSIQIATRWSPVNQTVLIRGADTRNRWGYFAVDVRTGVVRPALLFDTPGNDANYGSFQWSANGKSILFRHTPRGIVSRVLATGEEKTLFEGKANELERLTGFMPSPDGLSLAVAGDGSRGMALMVQTGADPPRVLVEPRPDQAIIVQGWTPNGQEILYTTFRQGSNPVENPHQLWAIAAKGGGRPRDTLVRISGFTQTYLLALSRDGRLAFTLGEQLAELWVLEHFLPKPYAGKRP